MKKNLIISPTGHNSLYKDWLGKNQNENSFDIIFLCYEDNDFYKELNDLGFKAYKYKGEKWSIIKNFLLENKNIIDSYDFFWFPDDDLKITNEQINLFFEVNKEYDLWLSQPSASGFTSHKVTNRKDNLKLRFTNFVEIMCPLMSKICLTKLIDSFEYSKSGWGLDFLWPKLLGYPKNKIAIIDLVNIIHTRPVGGEYGNRFLISPHKEMMILMKQFDLHFNIVEYDYIK